MHPILDLVRGMGGDAKEDDYIIEGEVPRFDHFTGRRQWIHFIVVYAPINAFIPTGLIARLVFKWNAGYMVGVVSSASDFNVLICTYRNWINSGEQGFFGMMLPSYMDRYKELYHPRE